MTRLAPATDATGHLTVPHSTQGSFIDQQRDECGTIIGRALEIVRMLTGRDLFYELLEPIAGDFDAVSAMQQGWHQLAEAAGGIEQNWTRLSRLLEPSWRGLAADRAAETLEDSARRHARQAQACRLIGDQLGHVVEVARSTTELICTVLRFIDSLLQEYLLTVALGPVGAAKALIAAKGKVRRLITLIDKATRAVNSLVTTVIAVTAALRALDIGLSATNHVLGAANAGAHAVAGSYVNETAKAGFGR